MTEQARLAANIRASVMKLHTTGLWLDSSTDRPFVWTLREAAALRDLLNDAEVAAERVETLTAQLAAAEQAADDEARRARQLGGI